MPNYYSFEERTAYCSRPTDIPVGAADRGSQLAFTWNRLPLIWLRFLFGFVVLAAAVRTPGKSSYLHATVGNVDVISAMSEEDTRKLLYELAEIREEIKSITGCTVVPQPSTQILVFDSQAEMDAVFPKKEISIWTITTKSGFKGHETGMAFALVDEKRNYESFRQKALAYYGQHLLYKMVPRVPTWIYSGLPDFLSTLRYDKGTVTWGAEIMRIPNEVIFRGKHSYAEMMNDATFLKTDEVWGLWHYWLTSADGSNRENVHRLFDALRNGAAGNGETVSQVFNVSLEALRKSVRKHIGGFSTSTFERRAIAEKLLGSVIFSPATDAEMSLAKATFFARMHPDPSRFKLEMMKLTETDPASPRAWEVMAEIATVAKEPGDAEYYWHRARELGTKKSYAYLLALREGVSGLTSQLGLEAKISDTRAAVLRRLADVCLELDSGEYETYYWLGWIEALAPDPQAKRLDLVEQSLAQFGYPGLYIPLATARLRSGQLDEARNLIKEYLATYKEKAPNLEAANTLLGVIEQRRRPAL